MKLQTEIPLKPEENQIDYSSKILLLGSCFSENIGGKFDYYKFQNLQNPFGVIFNPVSNEKFIVRAIDNVSFSEEDIFQHNEVWKCFESHSELSALDKNEFLENLNSALQKLREALFSSTHIIFTFGTAWVYREIERNEIVANCHKLPQKNFTKELLSIEEISESLQNIYSKISEINPEATIINTVSPVRHIKDGFAENSLSKAHLLSAIHNFKNQQSKTSNQHSHYFPSFEIMMDELRDYRFYAEDMLHPNKTAIEIIWQKFSKVWISSETETLQKEIASIQNGLKHRPLNPESTEHLQFSEKLQQKISSVKKQFPHINF
ncbi:MULTISPECIES: GSCFA domain-containing protein [Aequorivita]|uniref:GSCFA domain-containing protein n=1 Tax=Aequorivita iocasae TaxID=2803865 RepID=A0ABX7DPL6_9FLAO|nr:MULTISPECIES: GSCFA domain-containing protein [Aequorivita]QQX75347.1 GSCFA domain-containing protein [Aequorivita iocasae]UCA54797.1 GSCFA domain-containing protein [Aequorivita sp. F7]